MEKPKSRIQGGGWSSNNKTTKKSTPKPVYIQPPKNDSSILNGNNPIEKNDSHVYNPRKKNDSSDIPDSSSGNPQNLTVSEYAHLVVNVNTCKSPDVVYIGRPGKWGNPFKIGPHGDREEVIRKYKEWITSTPEGRAILADAQKELPGKVLGCHCAPLPCHGNVLAELVNQSLKSPGQKKPKYKYSILEDGIVLLRKAFNLEEQQILCDEIAKYGRGEVPEAGSFFSSGKITKQDGYVDPLPEDSDPNSGYLNIGGSKARMNVPFEICSKIVWEYSKSILDFCSEICPSIPYLEHPTSWRLNYYGKKGRIGWHFDRHPYVPMELQHTVKEPVISVTLGNAGIFEYRKPNDEIVSLTLESGDVIVFGGPARQITHQVPRILPNTKPPSLNMGNWPDIINNPMKRSFNEGRFNFAFYDNRDLSNLKN